MWTPPESRSGDPDRMAQVARGNRPLASAPHRRQGSASLTRRAIVGMQKARMGPLRNAERTIRRLLTSAMTLEPAQMAPAGLVRSHFGDSFEWGAGSDRDKGWDGSNG